MAGKFIRGALIEFMPTFLIPLPNVIVFQFNPETIRHSWTQAQAAGGGAATAAAAGTAGSNPLAVQGMPGEAFSFTLAMDAGDQIAEGNPIAITTGIYSRLAALEMLLYPTGAGSLGGALVGSVSAALGGGGGDPGASVPASVVPTVLFIWGPGRIVPVRVTGLSITEKLYDPFLNPTHAEAQIELKVLTPDELAVVTGPLAEVAKAAYKYSQGLRQVLALANLANAAESIIGMIPM
ncbi:MAG TPA: hypothetical protein VFT22_31875 [Kofleriaceae bacterium]|nr:hypothetical protein [Kofleriaceae bacterium]